MSRQYRNKMQSGNVFYTKFTNCEYISNKKTHKTPVSLCFFSLVVFWN